MENRKANKHAWVFALLSLAVSLLAIGLEDVIIGEDAGYGAMAAYRFGLFAVLAAALFPLLKLDYMARPFSGWGIILKMGKVLLLQTLLNAALGWLVHVLAAESQEHFWSDLGVLALAAVAVGLFEEIAFREGIFMSLTRQLADRPSGALTAAAVSSLIFGAAHVAFSLDTGSAAILSALLKTLESAAFGFVLCGMLYKTGNFWIPVLVHTCFDLAGMVSLAARPSGEIGGYVSTEMDTGAIVTMAFYAFCIVIMIPAMRYAAKILKGEV